jgi:tRNA threonylcarbamoyladenosine biosynthesis protein TsaE
MDSRTVFLADTKDTRQLGARLAQVIKPGWIVTLSGGLGAGKTTLVQGLLAEMGERGRVRSPTFTIVETYTPAGSEIHHLDLYRFQAPADWIEAGLDDLISEQTILLIEWPEQGGSFVPSPDLTIELTTCGDGRHARLNAPSPRARMGLESLDLTAPNETSAANAASRDSGP